jgi:glycosidase
MKSIALIALLGMFLSACQAPAPSDSGSVPIKEKVAGLTVYEVNIRQHTAEGTLRAFIQDLPRLKELGVGVLWIMPVQPIGVKNRKEPLGSYYSIRNYNEINPEFGTEADFKELVDLAHQLGLYVILDWVPNHTAWDHPWITEHPDYYAHDEKGNIRHEADWLDIALLNHKNPETRKAIIDAMKSWITRFQIDGFRCDHAGHEIPMYFWEEARVALNPIKDLFWLAEWDGARMHLTFDATYAWPLLHITDDVLPGKTNANDIADWVEADIHEYGQQPFRLTMITNHDENSWHGTEFERYGDGMKTFATFIFTAYGMPMLYSGQEAGLNKRLKFFEKDTIDWSDPQKLQPFYRQLTALHQGHPALWAGQYGGQPVRINTRDSSAYAFSRTQGGDQVIGIMNFSGKETTVNFAPNCPTRTFKDYFSGAKYDLAPGKSLLLRPWQYLIFTE